MGVRSSYGGGSGGPTNVRKLEPGASPEPQGFLEQVGGAIFGNQNDPGLLGTGHRQVQRYDVDPNAANIPGYQGLQDSLARGLANAGGRAAPQVDARAQDQMRAGQNSLISGLQAQAGGTGPSLAQNQLRAATDRNLSQALAVAQTAGAGNAGALRNVANQRAAIGQEAAGQSADLRLNEQMQAQNQLGQVLAGARGQDIALGSQNAQLQQGQNALNDNLVQFYTGKGLDLATAQTQARMQMEQMRQSGALGFEGLANQSYYGAADTRQQYGQGLINGLSRLAGLGAGH